MSDNSTHQQHQKTMACLQLPALINVNYQSMTQKPPRSAYTHSQNFYPSLGSLNCASIEPSSIMSFKRPGMKPKNPCKPKRTTSQPPKHIQKGQLISIGAGFGKDQDPTIHLEKNLPSHCFNENSICRNFGEDAAFISSNQQANVIGLSDGVGGWRNYGVDASRFSMGLMSKVKELVGEHNFYRSPCPSPSMGNVGNSYPYFRADLPVQLLSRAYNQLTASVHAPVASGYNPNQDMIGSGTALLANFCKETLNLYTANLGDSGFLVVRNNEIVHKSTPQCHHFNAPYQLAILPNPLDGSGSGHGCCPLGPIHFHDTPQKADFSKFQCEEGDVVILASDGFFDNVHLQHVCQLLEMLDLCPRKEQNSSSSSSSQENIETESITESIDSGHFTERSSSKSPKLKSSTPTNNSYTHHIDRSLLEKAAVTFVTLARKNAYDQNSHSPFSIEARKHGYTGQIGGKIDDITVVVGVVCGVPTANS